MNIVGGIILVLIVIAFFYFAYRFTVGCIKMQIEQAVDKTAPLEVEELQREKAEIAILQAMNSMTPYSLNNYF